MTTVTRYDVAAAAKERNRWLGYARTYKTRAQHAAWDLRPVDYPALIADAVRSARQWHRIWRERRVAVRA